MPQDDTYTESYISTIGVDFVSFACHTELWFARGCWKLLLMSSCWFPQKIRTVELDGKVIKLQIVSWQHMSLLSTRISIDVVEKEEAGCSLSCVCSGTRLVRSASGQSQAVITGGRTALSYVVILVPLLGVATYSWSLL